MGKRLSFWIKERINPQLGVYYVPCGQMSMRDADKYESGTLYGSNIMHRFNDEDSYKKRIEELKAAGESVRKS